MEEQRVVVTDVHISFGSMVVLMVKWTLAAIPAVLIAYVIGYFALAALVAITSGTLPG